MLMPRGPVAEIKVPPQLQGLLGSDTLSDQD